MAPDRPLSRPLSPAAPEKRENSIPLRRDFRRSPFPTQFVGEGRGGVRPTIPHQIFPVTLSPRLPPCNPARGVTDVRGRLLPLVGVVRHLVQRDHGAQD
jgi:hypothetical protein